MKNVGEKDVSSYYHALQDESRIGARINVSDTLYGRFEYGPENRVANVRMLYGRWDFGGGRLYVGKYYTPMSLSESNQVYVGNTMVGFGALYAGLQEGLKLTFMKGAIQIGAYDPSKYASLGTTKEYKLPKVEASIYLPLGNLSVYGGGGYQTYETDEAIAYYLQAVITLAPGVSITPEIGVMDLKKGSASCSGQNSDGHWKVLIKR